MPGEGRRSDSIGSLLVGFYEEDDGELALRYAGRVGTGFTQETLRDLAKKLAKLRSRRVAVHRAASRRRRRSSSSRSWSPRSSSASGRRRAPCARPRSRACATTATRARCGSRPTPRRTTPVRENRAREGFREGRLRRPRAGRARGGRRGHPGQGRGDLDRAGHPDAVPREHPLRAPPQRPGPEPPRGRGRLLAQPPAARGHDRRRDPRRRGPARQRPRPAARRARYTGSAEPLARVWIALRSNVRGVLERVTLADVVADELPPDVERLLQPGETPR